MFPHLNTPRATGNRPRVIYCLQPVLTRVHASRLNLFRSIGMMIGAIVGVGVFGLPYVFAQAGFPSALLWLIVMGGLLTVLQLMQAEVAIQTGGHHRLPGYVREYLGKGWSRLALVAMALGVWGAMLAYMIVGGRFLFLLVSPQGDGPEALYALIIAIVASAFIYRGLRFAARLEVVVVGALLFLFLFIIAASLPHLEPSALVSTTIGDFFLPYGVILFSLAGIGIVPEIRDVLGRRARLDLGRVVVIGMVIIVALYALFSAAVVGVTGTATTPIAFDGLIPVLGDVFRVVATALGALTILSIYLMLGIELLNTLKFDFRLRHGLSWALVTLVPVAAYLLGARAFIEVIGFVGAVFAGALGILVALTYANMLRSGVCKTHHCLRFPSLFTWILILLFAAGMVAELFAL